MAETNPAVREQLAKDSEARKKATEEYAKRMENAKPTPSQEENDRARLGDDVVEKADDGSGPEIKFAMRPVEEKASEAKPAAASYQTRQVKPTTGGERSGGERSGT